MKTFLFALCCVISGACAFAPPRSFLREPMVAFESLEKVDHQHALADVLSDNKRGFIASTVGGIVTGLCSFVARGMAADDIEYAELPPPYVPALFGVILLAGVGVLTASLGNVMDEEASLGLQSGARAKKEIERSRSSYFKRK